ncbi:MAG: GNAT family N-acetyltransferase [Sulfobacillus thermotolerans]|nr:GNAT family N-acetyltransferase [Sulfobacillus thermotolerans]
MADIVVKTPSISQDMAWAMDLWSKEWGGTVMVSQGRSYRLTDLEQLIAWDGSERVGLAAYHVEEDRAEILSLNATTRLRGIGSALLQTLESSLRRRAVRKVWLITSNDNVDALRFYQRRGYRLTGIHTGAIDQARRIKPSIPLIGQYGIPIHDEWELEKSW